MILDLIVEYFIVAQGIILEVLLKDLNIFFVKVNVERARYSRLAF